ncbi:MAG: hypothetical protein NT013_29170 [Planctomycetia bacterium]|nr:hypothetical protein [Planctomycetia bacterium]
MLLRRSWIAAGVLAVWMGSALAWAQTPTESPSVAASNPPENSSYYFDNGDGFADGLELGPQFRVQADYVFFTRQNRAKENPVLNGPDIFSQRDTKFDYNSGYRLSASFKNDDYEFEGSFFQLKGLGGSQSGAFATSVLFDGPDGYAAASPTAQAAVGPNPNTFSQSTLFSPLNTAANFSSVTLANNETNELEFLDPGATYQMHYNSDLQDFDFNMKGRHQTGQLVRFGFGYRNIQLRESGSVAIRGTFNTVDTDGDETLGNNDPNDGLSDAALTGAGLTLVSGAGAFSENTPPTPADVLLFTNSTRTTNQLNGIQATADFCFLETDYFTLGAFAKAGVFHNYARGSVTETFQDLQNGLSKYRRTFSDTKDRVAFAGNLGITGTFNVHESVRIFSSYEVMYLSGIALAPDQTGGISTGINNTTSLDLRTHGTALYHGGRIGIEFLFP